MLNAKLALHLTNRGVFIGLRAQRLICDLNKLSSYYGTVLQTASTSRTLQDTPYKTLFLQLRTERIITSF